MGVSKISDEKWIEVIREMRTSELSVRAWCAENGYVYNTVLRNEKRLGLNKESVPHPESGFTRIEIVDTLKDNAPLSISLAGITINIEEGFCGHTLRTLIKELRAL